MRDHAGTSSGPGAHDVAAPQLTGAGTPADCPLAYVIVLSWNSSTDIVECLESVLRSDYPRFHVVVCDNGSDDGSLEHVAAWAEGRAELVAAPPHPLRALTSPPVAKPIPFVRLDRATAEAGGAPCGGDVALTLIDIGENLGYAGGNNVGLRYALARDSFGYAWLLNPDTVVAPDALSQLAAAMEGDTGAGLCGSTVRFYDRPDRVQALGGATYIKWLGVTPLIGSGQPAAGPIAADRVRARLSLILGASTFVSSRFLRDVGLMSEDYFLFYEELEWATRARGRYRLAYAPESIVYHRQGRSTGLGASFRTRSVLAERHMAKSRLIFTRKHHPGAQPTVWLTLAALSLCRMLMGQRDQAKAILDVLTGRS